MPTPSHGPDCQTVRSYPTECPSCKERVVYYECSHGSRMFFHSTGDTECFVLNTLGDPNAVMRERSRKMEQREIVRLQRRLKPSNIPFRSVNASEHINLVIKKLMVVRETPHIRGRIAELDEANQITRSLLGIDQPISNYRQITLADTSEEPASTYSAIIETKLARLIINRRGDLVGVTLESRGFGDIAEWFVTDITSIENVGKP